MKHVDHAPSTVISSWAIVISRTYASHGLDEKRLLADAQVDEKTLSDPDGRIEIEKVGRLWNLAVERSGDPRLGLKVVSHLHPISFHALGPALMASRNLFEAMERLCRDYHIISDEVEVRIDWVEENMALCFTPIPGSPLPVAPSVEAFMAVAITYARMLDSPSLNPLRVEFMHRGGGESKEYGDLSRSPVLFSRPDNLIVFSSRDVHRTLPNANPEIARQNDRIVIDYLARYKKKRIDRQVRARLIELLPGGEPGMEAMARSMGLSRRSLHRYLQNQGASFREILDETRRHLADLYIRQPHFSVTEIAFMLGYSDSSNFSRAFRRWFGSSPNAYRKTLN